MEGEFVRKKKSTTERKKKVKVWKINTLKCLVTHTTFSAQLEVSHLLVSTS